MRKKTIALVLAMVMLLTLALSGCGGDTTTSGTTSGDTSTTSGTTSTDDGGEASTGALAGDGITTQVGTERSQTLIVETQTPTDTPGQFNTYMMGTTTGMGIHQLLSAHLWEMDSVKGEQFPE